MKLRLRQVTPKGVRTITILLGLFDFACRPLVIGSTGDVESSGGMSAGGSESNNKYTGTGGFQRRSTPVTSGGSSSLDLRTTKPVGGMSATSSPIGGAGVATTSSDPLTAGGSLGIPPCVTGTQEIRGRITLSNQQPLAGIPVKLSGGARRQTLTDNDGRYNFTSLCSGAYTVTPESTEYGFCTPNADLPDLAESVDEDFTAALGGCQHAEYTPRVLVVAFDPWVLSADQKTKVRLSSRYGWSDPTKLAPRFRRAIESITLGRIHFDIKTTLVLDEYPVKSGGVRYSEQSYLDCLADHSNCFEPDTADFAAVVTEHDLCGKSNLNGYEEIWFFGAPYFGFPAVTRVGDTKFDGNPAPVISASCGRLTSITGFNYERNLQDMLRVFHKRTEETLAYGLGGFSNNRMQTRLDQFAMVAAFSPDYNLSGCGSAYVPLNSSKMDDYGNTTYVRSFCDDYLTTPLPQALASTPKLTNCTAWGCTGLGYHRYVLSRFPTGSGLASDGTMTDFYRYAISNERLFSTAQVTCSSTYADGWCAHLTDGTYGKCNENEWATLKHQTGWVEFAYVVPKTVKKVVLHDRACVEQVTRGHLEFSDNSVPIEFGPLEDSGNAPTTIEFSEKQLTWFRVVIDASTGGDNVGLGEVIVE